MSYLTKPSKESLTRSNQAKPCQLKSNYAKSSQVKVGSNQSKIRSGQIKVKLGRVKSKHTKPGPTKREGAARGSANGSYNRDNIGSYNRDNIGSYNRDNIGSYRATVGPTTACLIVPITGRSWKNPYAMHFKNGLTPLTTCGKRNSAGLQRLDTESAMLT